MLRSVREMTGYTVRATDGEIGRVTDFYFDDERWTVRYLVVAAGATGDATAGSPRSQGTVLVSPMAVTNPDFDAKRFDLSLTREQVLNSPDVDSDQPLSREWEQKYATHYGWPSYWLGPNAWGTWTTAIEAATGPLAGFPLLPSQPAAGQASGRAGDVSTQENHLRSAKEVVGYGVQASDGAAGLVEDFLVDDRSWQVLHIVVDTTRFWPGGEVVVPADMAQAVEWPRKQITFDMTRDEIKRRAEFRPADQTEH